MSKTCIRCGAPLADDARFCSACGTVQPASEAQQAPIQPAHAPQAVEPPVQPAPPAAPTRPYPTAQPLQPQQPYYRAVPENVPGGGDAPSKKSRMGLGIAVVSVIAVVIIAAIVLGIIFIPKAIGSICGVSKGADTPEDLLQKMGEYCSGDSWNKDALYGLIYEYNYCREDEKPDIVRMLDSEFNDAQRENNIETYGEHYTLTFLIVRTETLIDADRSYAVSYLEKNYRDTDHITEMMNADVTMTLSGARKTESSDSRFAFVRVDGKWFYAVSA